MQTPGQRPGLIVAPLTPFTSDLKVDEAGLARQIDYVVKDCRATMVVAAGVETQEYTYLSLAERKDLIRRTIELTDNRVSVMVGISHASFKTAIELAHDAERWGAAAVQLWRRSAPLPARRHKATSLPTSRRSAARPSCRSRSISTPALAPTFRSPTPLRSPSFRRCSSSRKARATLLACLG